MNSIATLKFIYNILDFVHDYLLHPIFKDQIDQNNKQFNKLIDKVNQIQKQIKQLKNDNKTE